jgi:hypothetical protein
MAGLSEQSSIIEELNQSRKFPFQFYAVCLLCIEAVTVIGLTASYRNTRAAVLRG